MTDFHFLNPYWLLLLFPLAGMLWWINKQKKQPSAWHQVIEPQLLQHLLIEQQSRSGNWPWILTATGGLLGIIALANPVWEQRPQSVFQTPRAMVLVLDLSASMTAADLKPSRLMRARLKVQDILDRKMEGQIGLVVFAGDAFSVTPLTRDTDTITSQLRVLQPGIMPVQGSRADLGLKKAGELLQQAGIHAGDILLIADGYDSAQTLVEAKKLHQLGHRISVLGVGTVQGAPISNGQGDVFKDNNNVPILARLEEKHFQQLSKTAGGRYSRITLDNSDLDYLLNQARLNAGDSMPQDLIEQNQWKQNGPYLTLLLLPLAALAFRRGWLLTVALALSLAPVPNTAMAFSMEDTWDSLWQTREQRAAKALQQQQHQQAIELSSDPARIGGALYQQQKYAAALEQFEQLQGPDADYNRGNALARLGSYQDAIEAYDKALQQQPDMQHAIDNRAAVEALLRQMQQQPETQDKQQQGDTEKNQPDNSDAEKQQQESGQQNRQDEKPGQSDQSQQQQAENSRESPQQSAGAEQQGSSADSQGLQENNTENNQPGQQEKPADNQFSDAAEAMKNQQETAQQNDAVAQTGKNDELKNTQPETTAENQLHDNPANQQAAELDSEERQAAEQWLRRIPDDPGGLLKRKFLFQYQQRNRQPSSKQPW